MKPTDTQQASTADADFCAEMRTMSGQGFNQGEQATGKVWKAVQFRSRDEAIQSLCRVVFGADPVFPDTPPAPSLADAPKPKRVFLDEVAPYDPPPERPTLITAMEAGAQMGKTTLLSEWAERTLGTPKGERPKLADKIRHHLQVQFPATEWHIPLKDMLHTVALMEEFYHDEMERNADLERQLAEAREQRDRLADALRKLYRDDHLTSNAYRIIEEAIPGIEDEETQG